jgi:hypothetical protein
VIDALASAALLVFLEPSVGARVQTTERVVEAVRRGGYVEALALVERESDPLQRAQAECYLRHQAGDLSGAYDAARRGLAVLPSDRWLLERATYIALTLREASAARAHLAALEEGSHASGPGEGDGDGTWLRTLDSHRSELGELSSRLAARDSAASRARWISGSALVSLLAAFALSLRGSRRPAKQQPGNRAARR